PRSRTRTHLMERELYGGTRILFLQGPEWLQVPLLVSNCSSTSNRFVGKVQTSLVNPSRISSVHDCRKQAGKRGGRSAIASYLDSAVGDSRRFWRSPS